MDGENTCRNKQIFCSTYFSNYYATTTNVDAATLFSLFSYTAHALSRSFSLANNANTLFSHHVYQENTTRAFTRHLVSSKHCAMRMRSLPFNIVYRLFSHSRRN